MSSKKSIPENEKLVLVWSSGERDVALKTVLLFSYKSISEGWWKHVTLIIWGPSQKIVLEDSLVRNFLQKNINAGVEVIACKSCATDYNACEEFEGMGIDVRYVGQLVSEFTKGERKVMTF